MSVCDERARMCEVALRLKVLDLLEAPTESDEDCEMEK